MIEFPVGPQHRVVTGIAGRGESCGDVVHRCDRIGVVLLVACDTGDARQVVIVVDVTVAALPWGNSVRSGQREPGAVVVERRIQPRRGAVARTARLREVRRNMARVIRALIILQMARHASRAVQRVVVVDVAVGALARRNRVHSG